MPQDKKPGQREWPSLYPRAEWPSQNIIPSGPPVPSASTISDIVVAVSLADVQVFTSSSTWYQPSGKVMAHIVCIGGGGGGGGGRRGAVATNRLGGGGGAGGGVCIVDLSLTSLAASETVIVGIKGLGGSGGNPADMNGDPGADGVASSFTVQGTASIFANGGTGGLGGSAAAGPSRGGVNGVRAAGYFGGGGGDGGDSDTAGPAYAGVRIPGFGNSGIAGFPHVGSVSSIGNLVQFGAAGGGGGGGIDNANVNRNGGVGGDAYGLVGGNASAVGTSSPTGLYMPGAGGGGGDGGGTNHGGAGGAYGGGGGGGGAQQNGGVPGNGGNGSNGIVIVISY